MIKVYFLNFMAFIFFIFPVFVYGEHDKNIIEFYGSVKSDGIGLENISVTDGINVVKTDINGKYVLKSDTNTRFIHISTPTNYQLSMTGKDQFFYRVEDRHRRRQKKDFILVKTEKDDFRHSLIVCADPQVGFNEEVPLLEGILADIRSYTSHMDENIYGIVCGDLVVAVNQKDPPIKEIVNQFSNLNFPFFFLAGNHDLNMNHRSNENSKKTFEEIIGPTYYSFNRGKVHYVILDDVFYTGRSSSYIGYIPEHQLKWLEQDLANIKKGSTVVISLHIPTYSKAARNAEYQKEEINKIVQNRDILYKIVKDYNVHIMSGHEHYQENYLIKDNIYEHVHAAMCGIFWQAPYNSDGTPIGYTIYNFDGDQVSWQFKAAGKNIEESQFDAYVVGADKSKPESLIVNVWNYDPKWKVLWYENGVKSGEMNNYSGLDPNTVSYVNANKESFRYNNIGAGPTSHLFYATPKDANATIEIEVIDRFNKAYRMKPRRITY